MRQRFMNLPTSPSVDRPSVALDFLYPPTSPKFHLPCRIVRPLDIHRRSFRFARNPELVTTYHTSHPISLTACGFTFSLPGLAFQPLKVVNGSFHQTHTPFTTRCLGLSPTMPPPQHLLKDPTVGVSGRPKNDTISLLRPRT